MNTPDKNTFLAQMTGLAVTPNATDIRTYPSFLKFFSDREAITKHDFVVAANFTYGWMPTILELNGTDQDWDSAATLLTAAKNTRITGIDNLRFLMRLVNNSLVGTSKMLHFVNPTQHAIWDSRVYRYLTNEEPYDYRVSNVDNFLRYLAICDEIATWPELPDAVTALSQKTAQDLTPFRAIELTMYTKGGKS